MQSDVVELVQASGCTRFGKDSVAEFISRLRAYGNISTILDLHGVLDTIPSDASLPNSLQTCCISFVGQYSQTRNLAREEMQRRLGRQVAFGVLVFKRGGNRFRDIGGKAWVIDNLSLADRCVFIDDSSDHVSSVDSLNIKGLPCIKFQKTDNLLDMLLV